VIATFRGGIIAADVERCELRGVGEFESRVSLSPAGRLEIGDQHDALRAVRLDFAQQ
jgi:hypothetical protein